MIVIGIDPGTIQMGWAIMRHDGGSVHIIDCGCWVASAKKPMAQRLQMMYCHLCRVIEQHSPHIVCLEKAFVGANAASALSLGCARGIVLLAAAQNDMTVQEIAPNSAKKNLTGRGHATKEDMIHTVQCLFGMTVNADAADAVALALSAHVQMGAGCV
jgi:crossover junction endodeoxyribonuclease RuvC